MVSSRNSATFLYPVKPKVCGSQEVISAFMRVTIYNTAFRLKLVLQISSHWSIVRRWFRCNTKKIYRQQI